MFKQWSWLAFLVALIAVYNVGIYTVFAPDDLYIPSIETVENESLPGESVESVAFQEETSTIDESICHAEESTMESQNENRPEPQDDELVLIAEYAPDIQLDIRYATANNFTHTIIYEDANAYIRYGTLQKLIAVQNELAQHGYALKIWDAYRSVEAQFKLWEIYPDASFVANPHTGYSNHSRGNTVDITLVALDGVEVEMPSAFDEFGIKAHRQYHDDDPDIAERAILLEEIMYKHGFRGLDSEWWHYADDIKYPIVR